MRPTRPPPGDSGVMLPQLLTGDQLVSGLQAPAEFQGIPPVPRGMRSGRFRAVNAAGVSEVFDETDFVRLNGETVIPLTQNVSTMVLGEPTEIRNYIGFRNSSIVAGTIYIAFGSGPATQYSWLALAQGLMILLDSRVPQDSVYAFTADATQTLTIVQSSTPAGFKG